MFVDFIALRRIRTFSCVTPAPVKIENPRDLGMLKSPSSRCSVPMYGLFMFFASCSAICRASLAFGVKRSKGCIHGEGRNEASISSLSHGVLIVENLPDILLQRRTRWHCFTAKNYVAEVKCLVNWTSPTGMQNVEST